MDFAHYMIRGICQAQEFHPIGVVADKPWPGRQLQSGVDLLISGQRQEGRAVSACGAGG